ncbi:MAG: hypothetical protein J2P57_05890 [Acidimicrobiaceae bacterium]|nr:hypothetical protein [Acidimicrobiaceae bacterium]
MGYPLDPGGVADYPVKVGSALVTMVDPHRGFEKAYNRWYERDHYYAGCMIGPYLFAGSRWVAPRSLKNLRWPTTERVAEPYDAGSYVSIYWVEQGHHEDHFTDWAVPQVHWLYANNRGFPERRHIHTVVVNHVGASYRDDDPVPVDLALDYGYQGVVLAWLDGRDGRDAHELHDQLSSEHIPGLLAGSAIEVASSWTPATPSEQAPPANPMPLGSAPGGTNRLLQIFFIDGDVRQPLERFRSYTDAIEKAGLADTQLVAPFYRTTPGKDTFLDQLW